MITKIGFIAHIGVKEYHFANTTSTTCVCFAVDIFDSDPEAALPQEELDPEKQF
jgi:hypothetical protein